MQRGRALKSDDVSDLVVIDEGRELYHQINLFLSCVKQDGQLESSVISKYKAIIFLEIFYL